MIESRKTRRIAGSGSSRERGFDFLEPESGKWDLEFPTYLPLTRILPSHLPAHLHAIARTASAPRFHGIRPVGRGAIFARYVPSGWVLKRRVEL
jgi:hypothetical protein